MPKNILIFSDGTGQAGGLRPDQRLSNIYKLYRATRNGPDSPIDPHKQIAFYDAGLGTANDEGSVPIRAVRYLRKFLSTGVGFGISRNIADCYEAILKHYEPGDRIFLFGFSRGAYTVRCVAGVLRHCGVPTRAPGTDHCPRFGRALRAIADEAVRSVYEHGAGRSRERFEPERREKAARFRAKYGSDADGQSNVAPYFIGVFDTVAALGAKGAKRVLMNALILAVLLGTTAAFAKATDLYLQTGFWPPFVAYFAIAAAATVLPLLAGSFKLIRDYPKKGRFRFHFAGWRSGFYDQNLDERVRYARHALAIDELRADFPRVPWASTGSIVKREGEPEWLRQVWFAGCHSDIGGSYPEDESRLSDVALEWMVEQATEIPHPVIVDRSKLRTFPSAAGMQHCEIQAMRDLRPWFVPKLLWFEWKRKARVEARGAPLHESVLLRFEQRHVDHCGARHSYRPEALRTDERVAQYYTAEAGE